MTTITQCPSGCITYGQMNLINDFRSLWTEIAIWSRSFMASTISGFSDAKAINDRLYKITESFKDKLQPFFGMEIAEEIQQLLLAYIINIQTMVTALYNKDPLTVDTAVASLYRISDEIADYMASINPYWERSKWQNLLYEMNERLIAETVALIGGEYEKEIEIRDSILRHALQLGDYTAEGVIHYLIPGELPENLPEDMPLEFLDLPTGPSYFRFYNESTRMAVNKMIPVYYCQQPYLTYGQMNLINDFRSLWSDISVYLRGYVLSSSLGNEALADAYSKRTDLIPEQFESKLAPFFGPNAGEKVKELLSNMLENFQLLVKAYIVHDEALINQKTIDTYNDINDLSQYLADINPYWSKEEWQKLLAQFLEMGMNELSAIASGDYDLVLLLMDNTIKQAQMLGDYMAKGLLQYLSPKTM